MSGTVELVVAAHRGVGYWVKLDANNRVTGAATVYGNGDEIVWQHWVSCDAMKRCEQIVCQAIDGYLDKSGG